MGQGSSVTYSEPLSGIDKLNCLCIVLGNECIGYNDSILKTNFIGFIILFLSASDDFLSKPIAKEMVVPGFSSRIVWILCLPKIAPSWVTGIKFNEGGFSNSVINRLPKLGNCSFQLATSGSVAEPSPNLKQSNSGSPISRNLSFSKAISISTYAILSISIFIGYDVFGGVFPQSDTEPATFTPVILLSKLITGNID